VNLCFNQQIDLEARRCYECNIWWALERGHSGKCPRCADAEIEESLEKRMKMERSIRSLRGALTRKGKRCG
jgi:uncharacterized paraquat-inducible protein A